MIGTAYPQLDATGIWVPGVKSPGTCEGSPCAPALSCRFDFTAGVVINTPGAMVTVHTFYSQELPTGGTIVHEYPPFATGAFQMDVFNYPVVCGGTYTSMLVDSNLQSVLEYSIRCTGCQ